MSSENLDAPREFNDEQLNALNALDDLKDTAKLSTFAINHSADGNWQPVKNLVSSLNI